jgi:Cys-tRNA(Pro)/Cys-tRNA(Cys) deacylase
MQTPVTLALDTLNVAYRTFQHTGPIESLEQAASERGQVPDQVVRSIVFRAKDEYVMVLVNGARQVAWPALRKYLGQSRVTMANEAELLASTGYTHGAVAPFGLPQPMRVLVDEKVFEPEELSLGSGVRGITVILKSADLRQALPLAEVGAFAA